MAIASRKGQAASHRSSKVTIVIGRRFRSPGVPAAVAGAVAALREARPDLVHEEGGNTWLGHRVADRDDATAAEIAAAVSAIADSVPAEVLWHPELLALAVCRIETDL